MMREGFSGPVLCNETDQKDLNIHCYMGKEDSAGRRTALSDDRVRIESVRFFLSGNTGDSITNLSQE